MFNNNKSAFTLAEILITLGIIGVVAAMTIPTLISNFRAKQYATKFKKTISTLNQAARMAEAKYDMNFGSAEREYYKGAEDNPETDSSICAIFNGTLSGATFCWMYDIYGENCPDDIGKDNYSSVDCGVEGYQLADGTIIGLTTVQRCSKDYDEGYCSGWIDVNGTAPPNKEVVCSNGKNSLASSAGNCIVNPTNMGDVFSIRFYEDIVVPETDAGWYVLNTKF